MVDHLPAAQEAGNNLQGPQEQQTNSEPIF